MGLLSGIFPDRKKKFLTKIDHAINKVKHGTYNYVFIDLLEKYDRDKAGNIAAAMTNHLFNEPPVGNDAVAFLETHRDLVQKEILRLKENTLVGNMVADAVQIKAGIIFNNQRSGSTDMKFGQALDTLKKQGFFKQPENVATPKAFLIKADKYYAVSLKKVKYL